MSEVTQKVLGAVWILFLIAMGVALSVVVLLFIYRDTPPFEPYENVHLINQDSVVTDGFALISVERCSKSERPVGVVSMVSLEHTTDHDVILPVSATAYQVRFGCTTTITRYNVPTNILESGQWRVVGVDIVVGNRRAQQNVLWTSAPFVVD